MELAVSELTRRRINEVVSMNWKVWILLILTVFGTPLVYGVVGLIKEF
jgi:hypothetical protein